MSGVTITNSNDDDQIYINMDGKNVEINEDYEIPILDMDKFKDSLLANLYSTIELLKKEMEEKKLSFGIYYFKINNK